MIVIDKCRKDFCIDVLDLMHLFYIEGIYINVLWKFVTLCESMMILVLI
ncbi:hypothetical protein EMUCRT_0443 [Ehrlichia cf. muris str. EmCRT]|uniref:Uncharacterized protein n=1 Tax=Ehrlichia cf. muris str. EmCRT TaxID=1359167 RepID=A0A0F3NEZ6_9RICK|nr:hypothetical protein EMUCRT_0443 [Ehrlichia cf. muris str. EmCRT]